MDDSQPPSLLQSLDSRGVFDKPCPLAGDENCPPIQIPEATSQASCPMPHERVFTKTERDLLAIANNAISETGVKDLRSKQGSKKVFELFLKECSLNSEDILFEETAIPLAVKLQRIVASARKAKAAGGYQQDMLSKRMKVTKQAVSVFFNESWQLRLNVWSHAQAVEVENEKLKENLGSVMPYKQKYENLKLAKDGITPKRRGDSVSHALGQSSYSRSQVQKKKHKFVKALRDEFSVSNSAPFKVLNVEFSTPSGKVVKAAMNSGTENENTSGGNLPKKTRSIGCCS